MLGAFLQRRGDQKSPFDWVDAGGLERSTRLSDGCTDYNALQHVSTMSVTRLAAFQTKDIVPTPLPAALEQMLMTKLVIVEADCNAVRRIDR